MREGQLERHGVAGTLSRGGREADGFLIAPGSIPRSLLRTFNFEIWKLKCLGACPEDLYS